MPPPTHTPGHIAPSRLHVRPSSRLDTHTSDPKPASGGETTCMLIRLVQRVTISHPISHPPAGPIECSCHDSINSLSIYLMYVSIEFICAYIIHFCLKYSPSYLSFYSHFSLFILTPPPSTPPFSFPTNLNIYLFFPCILILSP